MAYAAPPGVKPPSGPAWGLGGLLLAASMMVVIGVLQALQGLAAILDEGFFVVARNYAFDLDVTAWGWIHFALGVFLVFAGLSLFARRAWAGAIALALASVSVVANFFLVPYYSGWAILLIALDVFVIWALTRPGVLRA